MFIIPDQETVSGFSEQTEVRPALVFSCHMNMVSQISLTPTF